MQRETQRNHRDAKSSQDVHTPASRYSCVLVVLAITTQLEKSILPSPEPARLILGKTEK